MIKQITTTLIMTLLLSGTALASGNSNGPGAIANGPGDDIAISGNGNVVGNGNTFGGVSDTTVNGGSASSSVNSTNKNLNANVNKNSTNVNNENINANLNQNSNKSTNNNSNLQGQKQGQGQNQSTDNANNSNQATEVSVEGDVYETPDIPVSTAYAPGLAAGANTCMGSTSGGVQTLDLGISFGSTWDDGKCNTRMDAATLVGIGLRDAAIARVCQDSDIRKAIESTGKDCPDTENTELLTSYGSSPTSSSNNAEIGGRR